MKKRFLSTLLSLALVCALACPALAAADPAQFSDAAAITHWGAVATLTQLGVIQGKTDGSFDPAGAVTRGEAAKMVFLVMNGGKDVAPEVFDADPFSDCEGHWAADYIAYCAQLGILQGRGDGTFGPNDPLTGLALCKICLAMLGYDPTAYHLTGENWAVRVDELARRFSPSLYTDFSGVSVSAPFSREDTAQLIYNAIQNHPQVVVPGDKDALTGEVRWVFKTSDSTFLKQRFDLDELPQIPTQPA